MGIYLYLNGDVMFLFMGLYDTEEYDNEEAYEKSEDYEEPEDNEPVKKVIKIKNTKTKEPKLTKKFELPSIIPKIGLYVGIAILLVALIFIIYLAVKPNVLNVKIKPNPSYLIYDYAETTLNVNIKNTFDYSLQDLTIKIKPKDSDSIVVMPLEDIKIPIIGEDESRNLSYKLASVGNINPGKYRIDIELLTPQEVITESIFWEIKSRK